MSEQTEKLVESISNVLSPKQLEYASWEAAWTGNMIRFGIITALLLGACVALIATFSIIGISNDWSRQRCSPLFMPFAELFGYDASENFKFCITNMMQNQSSEFFAPIFSLMGDYGNSIQVVIETVNGFRKILGQFKLSVNQYFGNVAAKIQTLLFQVRLSFMKMQTLMGRVYGTFYSIVWMGTSAITAGLNLSNNGLVNFVFEFCFHPKTLVRLVDGSERTIDSLLIGHQLEGGHKITSLMRFSGHKTPMVQIGSDILSASHMIYHEGSWKLASQHPNAISVASIPELVCLNVKGHVFSLASGLQVADYDESSNPIVENEVQAMAEKALNGSESAPTTRPSYTLGFDWNCLIQMVDGSWKPASQIRLGDRIVGNQEILGIVEELSDTCMFHDIALAPSQLIYVDGLWHRAGSLGLPTSTRTVLRQFTTDRAGPIVIRKSVDVWVRDYREAPLPEMEDPYMSEFTSELNKK
jgi:hypothetical protein